MVKESAMVMKKELEVRVEELEQIVKPFVQFGPQMKLAERRGVKVVDIGVKADWLRSLVDHAMEIAAREASEGE